MATKARTKSDPKIVEATEIARMGARAYAVKRKVSPQRWRRIVKDAHARGFTVDSFLNANVPAALKERTQAGIKTQATNTIASAYAPSEAGLSQQEERVKSVGDKRARDNRYYLDWLTARSTELATHSRAADQALQETHKGIQQDVATQEAELRNQLVQQGGATAGNVSDPNQAAAFDLSAESKRNLEMVAAARTRSADIAGSAQKRQSSESAINFAAIAASESRRQADLWNSLKDVADDRTKLTLQKGADTAKEISRLLDLEVDKANSNREFSAVLDKLDIQQSAIEQRADAAELSSADKAKERARKARQDAIDNKREDAKLVLDGEKLKIDWYKAKHPGRAGKGGGKAGSGRDPQQLFDEGVALLASSTYKEGKKDKPFSSHYVRKRRDAMIAAIVAKLKVSRTLATRAVDAFIGRGGGDPGSFKDWNNTQTPHIPPEKV